MKCIEITIMLGDRSTNTSGEVVWYPPYRREVVLGTYESDAAGMAADLLGQAKRQLDRMIAERDALMERKIG